MDLVNPPITCAYCEDAKRFHNICVSVPYNCLSWHTCFGNCWCCGARNGWQLDVAWNVMDSLCVRLGIWYFWKLTLCLSRLVTSPPLEDCQKSTHSKGATIGWPSRVKRCWFFFAWNSVQIAPNLRFESSKCLVSLMFLALISNKSVQGTSEAIPSWTLESFAQIFCLQNMNSLHCDQSTLKASVFTGSARCYGEGGCQATYSTVRETHRRLCFFEPRMVCCEHDQKLACKLSYFLLAQCFMMFQEIYSNWFTSLQPTHFRLEIHILHTNTEQIEEFYCLTCRTPVCPAAKAFWFWKFALPFLCGKRGSHCLIIKGHKGHEHTTIDAAYNTGKACEVFFCCT